ncbi:MAG TPA: DotU family type IV/VI secretion system protein [Deltaproteobacteria bacterium]|nr:DotU family type IV/VI secretion system protein [Deltaproteobacteria bacterium]HPR54446.1 DotU family type IV/VI secretion system protein [Deltaproteobacteria bacterium]HXK46225.1 DotU family type IV/VI secretion system protein [Deltaproteobacteria bacterium]
MHLSDLFVETIAYVVYFLKSVQKKQPPYDQVRARVLQLLSESQKKAADVPVDDYDQARFALCAWIDEALMNSAWAERTTWIKEPLQLKFYQTTNAGELFFERLNTLAAHQNEVREVYYLCLAMGFMGRYGNEEDRFLLDQLKTSNLKVLTGTSLGLPSLKKGELFPEAYPVDSQEKIPVKTSGRFNLISIIMAVFPVALFGVIYLIYTFVLHNVSSTLFTIAP